MLDRICIEYYGYSNGAVEAVLKHNPGLATLGSVYDAGVIIELPEVAVRGQSSHVRLWS
ncbi:tail protein X [Aestuariirhabdus sp. Z084]|nr:tail protein X [Aestuariirhabdus haliotis]